MVHDRNDDVRDVDLESTWKQDSHNVSDARRVASPVLRAGMDSKEEHLIHMQHVERGRALRPELVTTHCARKRKESKSTANSRHEEQLLLVKERPRRDRGLTAGERADPTVVRKSTPNRRNAWRWTTISFQPKLQKQSQDSQS